MKIELRINLVKLKQHGLSFNEWNLLEQVHFNGLWDLNEYKPYCSYSRQKLAEICDIARQNIRIIINKLEAKGLLCINENGLLKTSDKWREIYNMT